MTVSGVETYWLSGKKKFWTKQSVKKLMLEFFWEIKKTFLLIPLKKITTVKSASYHRLVRQNSPYLLNNPCIYSLTRIWMSKQFTYYSLILRDKIAIW